MPGPPPPPPPPIASASAASSGGGEQGRNLLLESIRTGKTLKKTVTNDKSAPVIGGKAKESTNGRNTPLVPVSNSKPGNNNTAPIGLGGLFAGGMPKLKPTGLRGTENVNTSTNTMKRGPPPAPPPSTQKPPILPPQVIEPTTAEEPQGYRKSPPKTPILSSTSQQRPSPPPKKLNVSIGTNVSRAQSMRLSRSPPVLAPTPPSLHQSQDCLNNHDNNNQSRPVTNRVLRPPVVRPPSPPTSKPSANSTFNRVAPPPPVRGMVMTPANPPPPPPAAHRTLPHQRLAPPPPPPPTPPTRCSSTRNGQTYDYESRFADHFHSISSFPPPDVFQGFQKVYNSKNAPKQQAPPPPPSQSSFNQNSMLPLNMSSSQGKQWHTSLAC